MSLPAFKKSQYAFTANLRDPDNAPIPEGVEERRMKIYQELVYNNTESFISNGFPVIRSIYNDENWHKMVRDFFIKHQCKTPYFLEIAQEFISYLQDKREPQPEDPAGLIELAHYEWAELALDISTEQIDSSTLDTNGDLLEGRPVMSPLAWSLAYTFPVHQMGPNNLLKQAPEQPTFLVVYRNRNDEVKFLEINPVTARLIDLLQENENMTGLTACQQIADEMNHSNSDIVIQGGHAALQELQSYGIILGTQH